MAADWQEQIQQVSQLVDMREKYQLLLGRICSAIAEEHGGEALILFAKEFENTTGRKISPTTLRNYRWCYERTKDLQLPEDVSYRVRQSIAATDNPEKWANVLLTEGISGSELIRRIREERGLTPHTKEWICKACGATNVI